MKRTIFLLLACSLTGACALDKEAKSTDPIENLVAYLDEQDHNKTSRCEYYEGGEVLKKKVVYFLTAYKSKVYDKNEWGERQKATEKLQHQLIDSCFRAFRWGCTFARQCYHKENHVMDKDTVLYALALDGLDGEKMRLEGTGGNEYWNVGFKAARAATLRFHATKEFDVANIEYITREETGEKEVPFDMRPLNEFIKSLVDRTDSAKVYETHYEYDAGDVKNRGAMGRCCLTNEDESIDTFEGITKGHLYVIPEYEAKYAEEELVRCIRNTYIVSNPNQRFEYEVSDTHQGKYEGKRLRISSKWEWPRFFKSKTVKAQELFASVSVDGNFCILVVDEVTGGYGIPSDWMHTRRIKDHKAELIPGV